MSEFINELWERAIKEHNRGDYHEAHEIFEDIWLELDNRDEKDIVQTLAQADALAVHIETCLLYTSPSPRDLSTSRMPSSA